MMALNSTFCRALPLACTFLLACIPGAFGKEEEPAQAASGGWLMPRAEDYTSMWWTDGFPGRVEGAPWRRCIQTGRYAFVMDTQKMTVPHFGPVPAGTNYSMCGREDTPAWQGLPSAQLELRMTVGGKAYRCTTGGEWSRRTGPRLIASGRVLQRADVTDLVFQADDGTRLNVDARFETVAWSDRLGLVLAARPGTKPLVAGEGSFGKVGGGFGLAGTNHLEIPNSPEVDPDQFTFEAWVFVPQDYQASERFPAWLVCKNSHEARDGHYGILISNGVPEARLNIGGGAENLFIARPESRRKLQFEQWNHVAMSYDGKTLRLYMNAAKVAEKEVGKPRTKGPAGLAIGRRQDGSGDGYHFRGVVDEIRVYPRALTDREVQIRRWGRELPQGAGGPSFEGSFKSDGLASETKPREAWKQAEMEVRLKREGHDLSRSWKLPEEQVWSGKDWREVHLALDLVTFQKTPEASPISVEAKDISSGAAQPVEFSPSRGWHRINLDEVKPVVPEGGPEKANDAMERVRLSLRNPTQQEQDVRLLFEKTNSGFRGRFGVPITGISAILRDGEGHPTGIPVQLSKNWHHNSAGDEFARLWFHGFSRLRLPPGGSAELELSIVYGHWGRVSAASHAQLCLIGWGNNQRWDQSALGAWGESICYEPAQGQVGSSILDVRPLMVRGKGGDERWKWTENVGGADYFRLFGADGERVPHVAMRAAYHRYGPCLTEVDYSGRVGNGITQSVSTSISRGDDLLRGIYRLRLDVEQAAEFSRFAIFQTASDRYANSVLGKLAIGNETGLAREWDARPGGNAYRGEPVRCAGRVPWISLHDASPRSAKQTGAWANTGIVIRSWKARLGGKEAAPWVAEYGLTWGTSETSIIDLVPPPGVKRLEPGDFVEAVIELVVVPQSEGDYYGPNSALRAALAEHGNRWQMIHREATGNDRKVDVTSGTLERLWPDIEVATSNGQGGITLEGGLGHVPVTFSGLASATGHVLMVDGKELDQSMHGNDFWQTDHDPETGSWSRTYNVPMMSGKGQTVQLVPKP